MAKRIIDNEEMVKEFFEETAMIGIVSAQPAYRFCWMINNHFDINFIREPSQDIYLHKKDKQKNENKYHFPIYQYDLPNSFYKYYLYKLKDGPVSLLPEKKQMDYLWLIKTAIPEDDILEIFNELGNIPDVQLSRILDWKKLEHPDNLLI